jgi:hypothetical protein
MSDDWKVGDLALCIEDAPCPHWGPSPYRRGQSYTVAAVVVSPSGVDKGQVGLSLEGIAIPGPMNAANAARFRKIRPDKHEDCEPEFVTLLKRSKVEA